MANRDRSQGVGYLTGKVIKINLDQKDNQNTTENNGMISNARVLRPEDQDKVVISKFDPPRLAREIDVPVRSPFDDLKNNIQRLQDLHSRLRFMLRELEDLVGKKDEE